MGRAQRSRHGRSRGRLCGSAGDMFRHRQHRAGLEDIRPRQVQGWTACGRLPDDIRLCTPPVPRYWSMSNVYQCLAAASLSFAVTSVKAGYGRHVYYLTIDQYYRQTKWGYISLPFDVTSSFAGRASFAVSLLMIMGTTFARKAILWSVIVLQFSTCVLFICIRLFACKPISRAWDRRVPGKCIDVRWASIYVNYIWLCKTLSPKCRPSLTRQHQIFARIWYWQ